MIPGKECVILPEFILETVEDTLKSLPILFIVYLVIEWLEDHVNAQKLLKYKHSFWGPLAGALAGCIPQCGFSAASATLYQSGVINAGTLIAVFLSTSDEALPIMISRSASVPFILQLILWKILIAILAGYLLNATVFRRERDANLHDPVNLIGCEEECHEHHKDSKLKSALLHTVKTALFIGGTLLVINLAVYLIGEDRLQILLLSDSVLQPVFTALIGLIPGCATSVLLVELLLQGSISFAAALAGLCSSTGLGFLILFKGKKNMKDCMKILFCTYLCSAAAGMILQFVL
jgi:hypothetical protein